MYLKMLLEKLSLWVPRAEVPGDPTTRSRAELPEDPAPLGRTARKKQVSELHLTGNLRCFAWSFVFPSKAANVNIYWQLFPFY